MASSLTKEFFDEIGKGKLPCVFVETGAFFGDTIEVARQLFDISYTIELSDLYYLLCIKRFVHDPDVHILHGDSAGVLPLLCEGINVPVFFYLDAHFAGHETAKSNIEVPLLQEVSSIAKRPFADIIVINDARLFGLKKNEGNFEVNWEDVTQEKILACFPQGKIAEYKLDYDRLIIYTNQ